MAKAATHHLGVYGAHLHIAVTRKQMTTLRRRYDLAKPESMGATWLTIEGEQNDPHLTVWVDADALDGPDLVDTIAHEAVHTAAQLLDHIGQATTQHDSEALAYLAGWVAARVWESVA